MNNKKTIIMNASPLLVHDAKRQLSFLVFLSI